MTHNTIFPDLPGIVWFLFIAVSYGFVFLIWRIIRGLLDNVDRLRVEMEKLRGDLVDFRENTLVNCAKCADKFRSKSEAANDWNKLTETLAEFKALAGERHRQIWEKIDNQTKLFMQEKQFLNDSINKNTERITRLELQINHEPKN